MTTKMKTKSALSYFGSDSEVAPQLAAMLDHCNHVTIPFVGGASILPHLKARAIICNDLNGLAINFYQVLSGVAGDTAKWLLLQRCEHTLAHPSDLQAATSILASGDASRDSLAWAYWAQCWLGRKGTGGTTKAHKSNPSMRWTANGGTNASRITSAAVGLKEWADTFRRCEWTDWDFRKVLGKVADQPGIGLYCDPPWIGAGDDYLHRFNEADHRDLAALLGRFEHTAIVIRYGDAPLLRELYPAESWHWIEAASRTQANKVREEVWITRRAKL